MTDTLEIILVVCVVLLWFVIRLSRDVRQARRATPTPEEHRNAQHELCYPVISEENFVTDTSGPLDLEDVELRAAFDEMKLVYRDAGSRTEPSFHSVEHVRVFDLRRLPSGQWQASEEFESNQRWRKKLEEGATRPFSSRLATEKLAEVGKELEWHDIDWPRLEPAYQLYLHHKDPIVDFPFEIGVMTAVDQAAAIERAIELKKFTAKLHGR